MKSLRKIVQIKKINNLELFPDKLFFLDVLRIIIREIKSANNLNLRKKKK